jgi:hypothetical protein
MNKIVAIHQPNFFPWLGFFDKMRRVDVFVLMNNVQFPKKGGSWMNRVRLLVSGKPSWITMPVKRDYHGFRGISEMEIDDSVPWRKKFVATLKANYSKALFFAETMDFLEPLIFFQTSSVSEFNIHAITAIASLAGWEEKLVLGSSLKSEGSATALLISMTKAAGGTAYLCGGGADGYQIDSLFEQALIELLYQNFTHPAYPQCGAEEFAEGLSVIDAMMNTGLDGWRALLETGGNSRA